MSEEITQPSDPPPVPPAGRAGIKLGVFVGGLVAALIAGFTLAKLINPAGPANGPAGMPTGIVASTDPNGTHQHLPQDGAGSDVGGLAVSGGGYTIVPSTANFAQPGPQQLSFRIFGPDGKPALQYAVVHEKPLHLVLARRDLSGYQHLHPTLGPDGVWTVAAEFGAPGLWRVFADFTVINLVGAQVALTLGYDVTVPGGLQAVELPTPATQAVVDDFTVSYQGSPSVGATQPMLFRVERAGAPVTLEPYLGSFGHLVVLREGDLGYVHVHPEPRMFEGAVKLWLAAPSPGRYRMFFDFQVAGEVRTASFTLTVPVPAPSPTP
jgi:hypothetical protein